KRLTTPPARLANEIELELNSAELKLTVPPLTIGRSGEVLVTPMFITPPLAMPIVPVPVIDPPGQLNAETTESGPAPVNVPPLSAYVPAEMVPLPASVNVPPDWASVTSGDSTVNALSVMGAVRDTLYGAPAAVNWAWYVDAAGFPLVG